MLRLVHGNDIVINTYEIQQIHIHFIGLVHINYIRTCGLPNNYTLLYVLGVIT